MELHWNDRPGTVMVGSSTSAQVAWVADLVGGSGVAQQRVWSIVSCILNFALYCFSSARKWELCI